MTQNVELEYDYSMGMDIDCNDVADLILANADSEAKLEIVGVQPFQEEKKGVYKKYICYQLRILECSEGQEGQYGDIFNYLSFPFIADDPAEESSEKADGKKRRIKAFDEAFGIDRIAATCDSHVGYQTQDGSWAILGLSQSEGYEDKNTVKRFQKSVK